MVATGQEAEHSSGSTGGGSSVAAPVSLAPESGLGRGPSLEAPRLCRTPGCGVLSLLLPRDEHLQLLHLGLDPAPLALPSQLPSSCTLELCPFRMRGLSPPLAPAPAAVSTLGLCFHFN